MPRAWPDNAGTSGSAGSHRLVPRDPQRTPTGLTCRAWYGARWRTPDRTRQLLRLRRTPRPRMRQPQPADHDRRRRSSTSTTSTRRQRPVRRRLRRRGAVPSRSDPAILFFDPKTSRSASAATSLCDDHRRIPRSSAGPSGSDRNPGDPGRRESGGLDLCRHRQRRSRISRLRRRGRRSLPARRRRPLRGRTPLAPDYSASALEGP